MEEVGVAVRVQGIYFVFRGCHQAMVCHHLYRHMRGLCWWMARHTSHVVSTLFFYRRDLGLTYTYWRLSGLREGRCARGFFWNPVECCAGMERM
jgi:hypothetical protein